MSCFLTSLIAVFALVASLTCAAVEPLRVKGLVAAVYTPFDSSNQLDTSQVSLQAKWLNSTGVHVEWAFFGGTTGESVSLTNDERKTLLEEWAKVLLITFNIFDFSPLFELCKCNHTI